MTVWSSSSRMLVGRVLILLLVAAGAVTPHLLRRRTRPPPVPGAAARSFACPMHPGVIGTAPGECPICRMALEPRAGAGAAATIAVGEAARATLSWPASAPPVYEQDLARARRYKLSQKIVAPAWVEGASAGIALLYRGEGAPGERGRFLPAGGGAAGAIEVRISDRAPERWDGRVFAVRFDVAPGAAALRLGEVGWLELPPQSYDAVMVPHTAVLQTPDGAVLFVASADRRTFTRRSIEVGRTLSGLVPVLSGVGEGERVVAVNAFFLDAEGRVAGSAAARAEAAP